MKHMKGKGLAATKSDMKQLHFRDTFNTKHCKELNADQKKSIL